MEKIYFISQKFPNGPWSEEGQSQRSPTWSSQRQALVLRLISSSHLEFPRTFELSWPAIKIKY